MGRPRQRRLAQDAHESAQGLPRQTAHQASGVASCLEIFANYMYMTRERRDVTAVVLQTPRQLQDEWHDLLGAKANQVKAQMLGDANVETKGDAQSRSFESWLNWHRRK